MQTGGIGSQDQWARFMQLSNMARMRNQGFSGNPTGTKRTAATSNVPTVPLSGSYVSAATRGSRSYTPMPAATSTRIVGGAFDAYA